MWFEPPDEAGDEVLHVASGSRSLRFKGYAFREFCERVVPLLDGTRSLAEIEAASADEFRPEDLRACLTLLEAQGVIVEPADAELPADVAERMAPQLNLFHDLAPGVDLQRRLAAATVALVGLGGAGPTVALALAAAGVGTLQLLDDLRIAPADVYYSPVLGVDAIGDRRTDRLAELIGAAAPQVTVHPSAAALAEEEDLRRAIAGADYVVCCLDAAQSNLVFKLNRVCLAEGVRWISCGLSGAEIVIGPAVHPGAGPCYMCYRMRAIACAGNPEAAFAYERRLDGRRRDESAHRENLVFSAGLAGNLLGAEVVKELSNLSEPSLAGRILTVAVTDLSVTRHTVLRKPGCPACFPWEAPDGG